MADLVNYTLAYWEINNHWVMHVFLWLQFPIVLLIYRNALPGLSDQWLWALAIGFLIFKLIDSILWHPRFMPTTLATSMAVTLLSLHYFRRLPLLTFPAEHTLTYWVCLAFFLYFTGSLALFGVVDKIFVTTENYYVWGLHALLNISKALLVTIGLVRIPPLMRIS